MKANAKCQCTIGRQRGAALIVLMVVFILGSAYFLMGRLNVMSDAMKQNHETVDRLNQIREALLGYAVANGRLPCPDTKATPNGVQNGPACNGAEGVIPWVDLGIPSQDAWGRYIRYRADNNFTVATPTYPPTGGSGISVSNLAGVPVITSEIAAVIFSCGVDGIPNATNDKNGVPNTTASCIDTGAGDTTTYVQDHRQTNFDDALIFLPRALFQTRMTAVGIWP